MKIYNTMTRRKDEFVPISPDEVRMYVCGQTVYNNIHIGNARFYVAFDAIRRYLEYKGYNVRFVQNFTDVDDKIIKRAAEENVPARDIAEKYIAETLKDIDALNVKRATVSPRATGEMPVIIEMIAALIDKGCAYVRNGSVFFDTSKSPGYGRLSRKNTEELEAGARVEINPDKLSPTDFVLWKPDKPGEPKWDSPWGTGRPGWHIECSAMIKRHLGDTIDIHGGGEDLIFPHHENEIAQSEAANGVEFARYWLHNGTVTMNHRKMSKSTGNFQTVREIAARFPYDVIRFYLLTGHYRMPMEYGDHLLAAARSGLERIRNARGALIYILEQSKNRVLSEREAEALDEADAFRAAFESAMDDDFNTADAIAAIFELVRFINACVNVNKPDEFSVPFVNGLRAKLDLLCGVLGISAEDSRAADGDARVEALIAERQKARAAKDWAAADKIRGALAAEGVILEDTAGGVRWSYKNK